MVNKAILLGRLGQDPELRQTQGGTSVTTFSIATSEKWTGKNGQPQEQTEWHRIVAWGKLAEICREYLGKGQQVFIEGKLQTRKWEGKNGETHYTTEVIAQQVRFVGDRRGGRETGSENESSPFDGGDQAESESWGAPSPFG